MMDSCSIRIRRLQNGYTVSVTDPAIAKENEKGRDSKDSCCAPWRDPEVTYTFADKEGVTEFIKNSLDKALPVDEYSSTFDKLVKDDTDD